MNVLESSGKPLFFEVAGESSVRAPGPGRGIGVRTLARSLSVMQKEALVTSSLAAATWRVASDEGAYLNGDDAAPCPLAHMTAGMVASFMETALRLSAGRGVDLGPLRLVQDNYYTMRGSALKGTMTGGALPVELTAEVGPRIELDVAESILGEAVRRAPVRGLMAARLRNRFSLTHNGVEIELGKFQIEDPTLALSGDLFGRASPAAGPDWSHLMRRNGMSPKTDEITSSRGSSYADDQSRQLHVRGICTLRADGVKVIEQQLFNPHGSIFYMLSDEGAAAGGRGRAPDALSYVSAGLAFCFLTQFGRYARIVGKPLRQYAVVQDTVFPEMNDPDAVWDEPVRTHVHLESDEDDAFAKKALAMSEQTCFLHALCRSEVEVRFRVVEAAGA